MNEHVIGLDVGDVRIGIAVSDATRLIASPLEVLWRVGFGPDTRRILELCKAYDTTEIVSGLPYNLNGTEGPQAAKVRLFCEQLEKAGLTVYYQDERLTTVTAEGALLETNMHRSDRRNHVDKVAAAVILQQWLDAARQQADNERRNTSMDEQENLIELVDENGETVAFEHLATLEKDDVEYIAMMVPGEEDDEEGEVVFMQIAQDDEGKDCYICVEDEDLQTELFDQFLQLMESEEEE